MLIALLMANVVFNLGSGAVYISVFDLSLSVTMRCFLNWAGSCHWVVLWRWTLSVHFNGARLDLGQYVMVALIILRTPCFGVYVER
jgi:hypothetical protein